MIRLINIFLQKIRKPLSFSCTLMIVTLANPCHASDLSQIQISTNQVSVSGVLEPQPYGFEIWLDGDLTDVAGISVSTPPGSNVPTINLVEDNGSWGWEDSVGYSDLVSLRADYATGDYVFNLYDGSAVLVDSVTLTYSPVLPAGFADITNPLPGSDVPYLSPVFGWTDVSGSGSFLEVLVDDASGDNKIYENILSIDALSWSPGDFMPASDYWLNVSVTSVNGFPSLPTATTVNGDVFTYRQGGRNINALLFSTSPANPGTTINFSGRQDYVLLDNGGGIYSGSGVGKRFSGFIDDVTANGGITDGETITTFECCIATDGLAVTNDHILTSDEAALLNALSGIYMFNSGDLVDVVDIEGDKITPSAGRIQIGLIYIFDSSTFSDNSLSNYPFNPNDTLVSMFYIFEEDATLPTPVAVYYAVGKINDINAILTTPAWSVADFHTLCTTPVVCTPSRAIEFDPLGNLYIEDITDDESGQIDILKLDVLSGYDTSSIFASYSTGYKGATGLDFDDLGSLYVSESTVDGDAGIIREVDAATQTLLGDVMSFANHRPTGVDADTAGNVYYSGRKQSSGTWGKLFRIDSSLVRTELSASTVATGIALDAASNVFISTPKRTDLPLLNNSVYMFRASDVDLVNPVFIAAFDTAGDELTFDDDGNLYMIAQNHISIARLTPNDTDGDSVSDYMDNCIMVSNPAQCDGDNDGFGNHCDADFNNDLIVSGLDVGPFKAAFGSTNPVADLNCDGVVNGLDVGPFRSMFGSAPGPSGLNP